MPSLPPSMWFGVTSQIAALITSIVCAINAGWLVCDGDKQAKGNHTGTTETQEWFQHGQEGIHRMGLFKYCSPDTCVDYPEEYPSHAFEFEAAQSLIILGLSFGSLSLMLSLVSCLRALQAKPKPTPRVLMVSAMLVFLFTPISIAGGGFLFFWTMSIDEECTIGYAAIFCMVGALLNSIGGAITFYGVPTSSDSTLPTSPSSTTTSEASKPTTSPESAEAKSTTTSTNESTTRNVPTSSPTEESERPTTPALTSSARDAGTKNPTLPSSYQESGTTPETAFQSSSNDYYGKRGNMAPTTNTWAMEGHTQLTQSTVINRGQPFVPSNYGAAPTTHYMQ